MALLCPNKSLPEWKYLVEKLGGEKEATRFYLANNAVLPSMASLYDHFDKEKSMYHFEHGEDGRIVGPYYEDSEEYQFHNSRPKLWLKKMATREERPVALLANPADNAFQSKVKRFGPINNIKDLNEYFKNNTASVKSFDQYSEEEFAESLMSTIRTNPTFSYAGKNWDFSMKSDAQIKETIKKEIIPDMKSFELNHKKKIIEWINNGMDINSLDKYFPGKKPGLSRFNQRIMSSLIQKHLDPNNTTKKYFLYSEIKDNPELQALGIQYDPIFEGYNPIIALAESPEGETHISIFDTTTMPLSDRGLNPEGNNLFANFGYGDSKAYLNRIPLKNTEAGIRQFYLGLLAMKLKHNNSSIKIKDVAVIQLQNTRLDSRYLVMQSDFIPTIQALRNIEPFMDLIPESISNIIKNKDLDKAQFDQPFLAPYRSFLENQIQQKHKLYDGQESYYFGEKEALNYIDAYQEGRGSRQEFIDLLKNRMAMLESTAQDKGGINNNEEYQLISAIMANMHYGSLEKNTTKDTSYLGYMVKQLFDTSSDIVQFARNQILRSLNWISEKLYKFKKEHNKQLDMLGKALQGSGYWNPAQDTAERILDVGGNRFQRLFKKRNAKDDKTKANITITANEIHWNLNDPETKQAISSGQLTKSEVVYGAWIVEKIKGMYIDLILHNSRFSDRMQGLTKEERLKKAQAKYAAEWKDGLIPVVYKSFSEKLASAPGKGAIKQFFKEMGNMDMFYHDYQPNNDDNANTEVFNGFMTELGSTGVGANQSYLGSSKRLEKLGLVYGAAGDLVLVDKSKNDNISTNLENIMDYFMLMGYHKIKMDTDALPMVSAARALLYARSKQSSQKHNIDIIAMMEDRLIHGKKIKDAPFGIDVDPVVNTLLAIATTSGLALNVPVWATAVLQNKSQVWTFAISNDIANGSTFFNSSDASKAASFIVTQKGFDLMLELMRFYQVSNMTERDLANSPLHKNFDKSLFQSHYMHIGGFGADYMARGWVMISQMIHDGTLEAHTLDKDNNIVYDEKKDKRLYKNGVITEEGKLIIEAIKQKMIEEGTLSDMKDPLDRAYNYEYAATFKYLADKYVVGGYDPTTYGAMESIWWGRITSTFKKYLPAKAYNAFGRQIEARAAIHPVISTDKNGKKTVDWNGNIAEGYVQTAFRIAKDLRTIQQMGATEYWKNMKMEEKRNIGKMAMDLAVFAILIGLYQGLTADWDDDQEEDFLKDSRMLRTFKYAGLDLMPFAPWNILRVMQNPMPAVDQSLRLFNIVVGDTRNWEKSVPLTTTYKVINETFGEPEE